jgi:hypothetical protein
MASYVGVVAGEPRAKRTKDVSWELRRVTSVPILVGDIVHESMSLALRPWRTTEFGPGICSSAPATSTTTASRCAFMWRRRCDEVVGRLGTARS